MICSQVCLKMIVLLAATPCLLAGISLTPCSQLPISLLLPPHFSRTRLRSHKDSGFENNKNYKISSRPEAKNLFPIVKSVLIRYFTSVLLLAWLDFFSPGEFLVPGYCPCVNYLLCSALFSLLVGFL